MSQDNQDKVIKIKTQIDNPSVQSTKAAVESITASFEKLEKVLQKVTSAMEAFGRTQGKTGKVGKTPTSPTGKPAGVAESIIGDANGVRQAAKVTETALSATGANIKRFVDNAIKDLQRLRNITGGGGGFGAGPAALGGGFGGGPRLLGAPLGSRSNPIEADYTVVSGGGGMGGGGRGGGGGGGAGPGAPSAAGGGQNKPGGGGGSFWGPRGWAGYLENRGQAFGRTIGLGEPGAKIFGSAGRFIGENVGVVGGTAMAALALWNQGAKAFENTREARINYTLNQPFMKMSQTTPIASLYQQQFGNVQSGNLSRVLAFNKAIKDPEVLKSLNSVQLDKEAMMLRFKESPLSLGSWKTKIMDWIQSKGANAFQGFEEGLNGLNLPEAKKNSLLEIAKSQALSQLPAEKAAKLQQAMEYYHTKNNPMANMMMDRIAQNDIGRVATMRANWMSTGINPKTGRLRYEELESKLTKSGWTFGDRSAGLQQLAAIGTGYGRVIGPTTLVGNSIMGFTNSGQLVQSGGVLGGSVAAGGAMYQMAQRSMGRGGLDVAVGRDLFGGMSDYMLNTGQYGFGNAAANYLGHAAGLVSGNGSLDVANQQYRMGLLTAGTPGLASITQGTRAPIYNAYSLVSAMSATGGRYGLAAEQLRRMDPTLLSSIAQGGDVPLMYQGMGIGQKSAQSFLQNTAMKAFAGAPKDFFAGTEQGELIDKIQGRMKQGGSWLDVIRDNTRGLDNKGAAFSILRDVTKLGAAMGPIMGMDNKTATGTFFAQLAADPTLAPLLSGKGIHAPGPAGIEKMSLDQKAQILAENGMVMSGKSAAEINAAFTEWAASSGAAQVGVSTASALHGDLEMASQNLIGAIQAYTIVLKSKSGPAKAVPHNR